MVGPTGDGRARADASDASPLTARQVEVLGGVAAGRTNRQIARALGVSGQTVKNHLTAAMRKTGAANRTQAAFAALRRGWLAPPATSLGAPVAEPEAPALLCYGCGALPEFPWAEVELSPAQGGAALCARCIEDAEARRRLHHLFVTSARGPRSVLCWLVMSDGQEQEFAARVLDTAALARFLRYD